MVAYYTGKNCSKKPYLVDLFKEMLYFCMLYKLVNTVLSTYYFSTNLLSQTICLSAVILKSPVEVIYYSGQQWLIVVISKPPFFAMASFNVGLLHHLAYTALIK